VEFNPLELLCERITVVQKVVAAKTWEKQTVTISTSSAIASIIPSDSIDYIFTDPPFGGNIMYSELNFIWESFLKVFSNNKTEAIQNKTQSKGILEYQHLMSNCFMEFNRILKPGRWMTVEFHNSQNNVWVAIQEALQQAGFIIADVRILDKQIKTHTQRTAAGSVNQDLAISAYKPNGGLEDRFKLEAGTEDGVWDFLQTHLRQLPVFVAKDGKSEVIAERQNYLLFDRMVAFHVQRGVTIPLSATEFYQGLEQRFSQRDSMYFLPAQVAEYDKKRMTVKDVEQFSLLVLDEASAIQWLLQLIKEKPQTFQEIHPQFLKEIGGWQKHEKPLELMELLQENFLSYDGKEDIPSQIHSYLSSNYKDLRSKTKDDTVLRQKGKDRWYVPDPNKAGDLEKLRDRTLLKEFWDYLPEGYKPKVADDLQISLPGLEKKDSVPRGKKLKIIRMEAVRAGFRLCWQTRDYKTIIAVAQRIPEDVLQEDPKLLMWYDQALTRMGE
jgi:hypothetical protein